MKNKNELTYKDLKMTCNPNIFNFDSTADLELYKKVLVKIEELKL